MRTIKDKDVKIFTDNVEDEAIKQIETLVSLDAFKDCKIRIMPDVHAGAGCVIGFTGNLGEKVIPNIVGVDIGCGISVTPFKLTKELDFHRIHTSILRGIPSGLEVHQKVPHKYEENFAKAAKLIDNMRCLKQLRKVDRLKKSLGTLGGGNHFIEIDKDDDGNAYIVIHTGSRNLGKQVADIYQKIAVDKMSGKTQLKEAKQRLIEEYRGWDRQKEIKKALEELSATFDYTKASVPKDLAWLEGDDREDYLHDMRLCQKWAIMNRHLISLNMCATVESMGGEIIEDDSFESVHNYIGDDNIIRKGAISAELGQRCVIPMNMRDGALICIGKGNDDWNKSAPHGAGRVMSRSKAFKTLSMDDFSKSMEGIYSETVVRETLDEAPMVYKPMEEIISCIGDAVDIERIIKPVFNFKAAE